MTIVATDLTRKKVFPPAICETSIASMALVSLKEAARILELAPRTVRRLSQRGDLERRRRGKRAYVTSHSVERLREARCIARRISREELAVRVFLLEARIFALESCRRGRRSPPLSSPSNFRPPSPPSLTNADEAKFDDYDLIAR